MTLAMYKDYKCWLVHDLHPVSLISTSVYKFIVFNYFSYVTPSLYMIFATSTCSHSQCTYLKITIKQQIASINAK